MQAVISFVLNHPEATLTMVALAESIAMPFVPVKWNGLAHTAFSFLKKKVTGK
jgi:hypothetical protein